MTYLNLRLLKSSLQSISFYQTQQALPRSKEPPKCVASKDAQTKAKTQRQDYALSAQVFFPWC